MQPHRVFIAWISALCLAGVSEAREDLDCKNAVSASNQLSCLEPQRDQEIALLNVIYDEMIAGHVAFARDDKKEQTRAAIAKARAAWMTATVEFCHAINEDSGQELWPVYWEAVCVRDEVRNRIAFLCEPNDDGGVMKVCPKPEPQQR